MCGITGFWRAGGLLDGDVPTLRSMMKTLYHRGPDGDGHFADPERGIAMGHTRLAIIDLHTGDQPLVSPDRRTVVTVNGELYDYKTARTRLICDGVDFSTKADSELALHLYRRDGLDFMHALRGEFAIAIFDADADRVVIVRDRFGIKPIYVRVADDFVAWGSEVKALLEHPDIPVALSPHAVLHGLMQTMVPGTTSFEGIDAIRPGHMMIIQRRGDRFEVQTKRWWDARFPQAEDHDDAPDDRKYIEQVRDGLIDAVRVRLEADVPVGCYLSGGIDSCSALGLATAMQQSHVKAFTISFDDAAYDEAHIAKEMADKTQADQELLQLSNEDLYGPAYERTVWHAERTFYNTLGVAKWHMSRRVHECGYKVVITGEGSDELFGGYAFFKHDMLRHCLSGEERDALIAQMEADNAVIKGALLAEEMVRHPALDDIVGFTPAWIQPWMLTLDKVRPMLAPKVREQLADYDPIAEIASKLDPAMLRGRHPLDKVQYTWIQTMLEGQILTWGGDRVDMANSMESRPPFLDHLLADIAFKLPPSLRIRDLREKWVLREAMKAVLPKVLYDREKFAFMAPPATVRLEHWAKVEPLVQRYLSREALADTGMLDVDAVGEFVDGLTDPGARHDAVRDDIVLNHLLGISMLHRQFVQGEGQPAL